MDDERCQNALVGLQYLLDSAIEMQRRCQGGRPAAGGHGLVTVRIAPRRAREVSRALAYLLDASPDRAEAACQQELNSGLPGSREITAVLRKLFPEEEAGNR